MEAAEVHEIERRHEQSTGGHAVDPLGVAHIPERQSAPVDPATEMDEGAGRRVVQMREQHLPRRPGEGGAGLGQELGVEARVVVGDQDEIGRIECLPSQPALALLQATGPPPGAGAADDGGPREERGHRASRAVARSIVDEDQVEALVGLVDQAANEGLGDRPTVVDRQQDVDDPTASRCPRIDHPGFLRKHR